MLGKDAERTVGEKKIFFVGYAPCSPAPAARDMHKKKSKDFVGWMFRNRQMRNNSTAVPFWVGHADSKRVPFEALRR
jgi:hypothetical protein